MQQHTTFSITGRTELGLNEYITTKPAFEDHGPSYTAHAWRVYTIQAQEDAHLFHLTEQFWNEATDRYYGDVPNDEPAEWPFPEHDDAPYVPCEQQAYVAEADGWTCVTTYDLSDQPTPFSALPIGAEFFDPFTKDVLRKTSALRGAVVASDDHTMVGATYAFVVGLIPTNDTAYPVLTHTARDLAEDDWVPEALATDPPADHPEGWNAPAAPVYPLPPAPDSPETQGIPVTYKVSMGNCYRLFHHGRQVAIVPNYAQGEVIAQALAATFAGRLADFSLTLDYIEGSAP